MTELKTSQFRKEFREENRDIKERFKKTFLIRVEKKNFRVG